MTTYTKLGAIRAMSEPIVVIDSGGSRWQVDEVASVADLQHAIASARCLGSIAFEYSVLPGPGETKVLAKIHRVDEHGVAVRAYDPKRT